MGDLLKVDKDVRLLERSWPSAVPDLVGSTGTYPLTGGQGARAVFEYEGKKTNPVGV
jgi:hypothetical protein